MLPALVCCDDAAANTLNWQLFPLTIWAPCLVLLNENSHLLELLTDDQPVHLQRSIKAPPEAEVLILALDGTELAASELVNANKLGQAHFPFPGTKKIAFPNSDVDVDRCVLLTYHDVPLNNSGFCIMLFRF